jgi:uncharacterized HAD superfamily protein
MKSIGIDLDGVVFDTWPFLVKEFNKKFDLQKEPKGNEFFLERVFGLTKSKVNKILKQIDFTAVPVIEDAIEVINGFYKEDYKISFITSRDPIHKVPTRRNLERLGIKFHHLLFQSNKVPAAKRYKIRFYIDDDNSIINKMAESGVYSFLYSHDYNIDREVRKEVIRVHNWNEIEESILNLTSILEQLI